MWDFSHKNFVKKNCDFSYLNTCDFGITLKEKF